MKNIFLVFVCMLVVACSKEGDERLAERSELIEKARIKADEEKAQQMVEDLIYREQFYQSLYGEYEGQIETGNAVHSLRISFAPHAPIFIPDRKLTVTEAEELLLKQSFNVQTLVVIELSDNGKVTTPCRLEEIEPDLNSGVINLFKDECATIFKLAISDSQYKNNLGTKDRYGAISNGISGEITEKILSGEQSVVDEIVGEMKTSRMPAVFYFRLERVWP